MKTLDVGIDISKAQDPWDLFGAILKAEPYIERFRSNQRDAQIALHYLAPDRAVPNDPKFPIKYFTEGTTIDRIVRQPDLETLNRSVAFEFTCMLDAHYIERSYRPAPCMG